MVAISKLDRQPDEAEIIGRIFFGRQSEMTPELASYFLNLEIPENDRERMSELLKRNQAGELSPEEAEEMRGYSRAGTLLAIFQSQARRVLKMPPPKPRRKP